jgi:hypothetical protein
MKEKYLTAQAANIRSSKRKNAKKLKRVNRVINEEPKITKLLKATEYDLIEGFFLEDRDSEISN